MDIEDARTDEARYLCGAALFIETYGWTRSVLFDTINGNPAPMCVLGAIGMAMFGNPQDAGEIMNDEYEPVTVLAKRIDANQYDQGVHANDIVAAWNDNPNRTVEQVLTKLRAAADQYEAAHSTTT